jgi:hypothetical protein
MAGFNVNPFVTTVAEGMFNTTSVGLRQGTAFPDPATRNRSRTTVLAADETLPMWGGVGVYMNVPGVPGGPGVPLGPVSGRANSLTGSKALAGFSVFDGAYAMVTTPQSRAPLAGPGNQVIVYPLGSLARIVVACDPVLVNLWGQPIRPQVSWDFVAQRLVPYLGTLTISSGTYVTGTGVITLIMSAPAGFGAGDEAVISSLTGTGAYADLEGSWEVTNVAGSTVTLAGPPGAGAATITGGSLVLGSGASSALPVAVLDVQATNCIVVDYDEATGFANYNFDGAAAVIQI